MQHLVRDAARQRVEHLVQRCAARQQLARARSFNVGPTLRLLVQGTYQRHASAPIEPMREARHTGVDDGFGLRHRRLAFLARRLHECREIVDGVEVDVVELSDLGLDVAWHCQVDHEHGAMAPLLDGALDRTQADDGQAACSARHHGVELMQPRGQLGQTQARRAKSCRELLATFERAIGHAHGPGCARRKVRGDKLDHFASADEEHADVLEVLEELRRKSHRGRGHADGMRADLGGAAHFLGHREGTLEELVQGGAQHARVAGVTHGLLHLAKDLRLAQHHRVQARGDAEGVARSVAVFAQIAVLLQLRTCDAGVVGEPVHGRPHELMRRGRRHGRGRREIELGAVAGRHQGCLGHSTLQTRAQGLQGRVHLLRAEGQPPAQVERSGDVVEPEGEDAHGSDCSFARLCGRCALCRIGLF